MSLDMQAQAIVVEAMQMFPEVMPSSTPASCQGEDVQLRSKWANTLSNASRMAYRDVFIGDGQAWRKALLLVIAIAIKGIKEYDARKN